MKKLWFDKNEFFTPRANKISNPSYLYDWD